MGAKLDFVKNNMMNIGMTSFSAAGIGAGAGYAAISNDPTSVVGGAAIGGVIGASILPFAGTVGMAGYNAISNIDKVGSASLSVGRGVAEFSKGALGTLNSPSPWKNPIGQLANMTQKAAGKLISHEPTTKVWNEKKNVMESKGSFKLSGWGKMAVGISAVAAGAWSAKETFESSRMGQSDSYITTATPRIPSYQENAGASGDLVFALNANRRG